MARSQIHLDSRPLEAIARDLVSCGKELIGSGSIRIDVEQWAIPAHHESVVTYELLATVLLGLLGKSTQLLQSMVTLASLQHGSEVAILHRAQLEVGAFTLSLLPESWTTQLLRYRAYVLDQERKLLDDVNAIDAPDAVTSGNPSASHLVVLEQIRAVLGDPAFASATRHWHPSGTQGALKTIGRHANYALGYRLGSRATHATDPHAFATYNENDGFVVDVDSRWIPHVLYCACELQLRIIEVTARIGQFPSCPAAAAASERLSAWTSAATATLQLPSTHDEPMLDGTIPP